MPTPKIRLVRSAPDSLGLYIRAGRIDKDLQGSVTAGSVTFFTGVVFEAKRVEVEKFFESGGGKARSAFGCRDTSCCPRGIIDKLQVPARHFLYQRTRQIAGLSQIPEPIRPTECLEEYLRPASDSAIVATKLDLPDGLGQKVAKQAKRLNDLRTTLGAYARERCDSPFARYPITRVARSGRH